MIKFVIVAALLILFGLLCYGLGFTVGRMDDGPDGYQPKGNDGPPKHTPHGGSSIQRGNENDRN